MKCPFCGSENLEGEDQCESCGEDLTAMDAIEPATALDRALMNDSIAQIPPQEAIIFPKSASIFEAVQRMVEKKVGCVLIVEKDELIGVVTERDILYKAFALPEKDFSKISLETVMTANPETLKQEDTVAYALNRMSIGGYRHIPILEANKVCGLVSVQGILSYMTAHLDA